MTETFRLKIVSKRQITVPQRMLNLLHLSEGDELQIDVANNQIQTARALKAVPTDLFSPEMFRRLEEREAQMRNAPGEKIDAAELKKRSGRASALRSANA